MATPQYSAVPPGDSEADQALARRRDISQRWRWCRVVTWVIAALFVIAVAVGSLLLGVQLGISTGIVTLRQLGDGLLSWVYAWSWHPFSNAAKCSLQDKSLSYVRDSVVSCLDLDRPFCNRADDDARAGFRFSVYPWPQPQMGNQFGRHGYNKASQWWNDTIARLRQSPWHTNNPSEACLLIPSFDHTLVQLDGDAPYRIASRLRSLPLWGHNGDNHVLFSKHDLPFMQYDTGHAIVAKVGWGRDSFRPGFDISLPPPLPDYPGRARLELGWDAWAKDLSRDTKYLVTFKGRFTDKIRQSITFMHNHKDIYVVHMHQDGTSYLELMLETQFALCPRGNGMYSYRLAEAMAAGAIPILVGDNAVLPFEDLIDWRSFAIVVPEKDVLDIPAIARSFTPAALRAMRCKMYDVYVRYFAGGQNATVDETIDLLRGRLFGFDATPQPDDIGTANEEPKSGNAWLPYSRPQIESVEVLCAKLEARATLPR